MIIALIVIILAAVFYLLALRGRANHPDLHKLRHWCYAHRGLHGNGIPENSIAGFRKALERGYGIELDVHLMADGNLAVIHDASLKRTADADVIIETLTTEHLADYFLEGTEEGIPTLCQVLNLIDGKAPIIVELKSENGNYAELSMAACQMLERYQGLYCIESFDPRCIRWLRKNRSEIIRGQLAHNSLRERQSKIPYVLRFTMTNLLSNFWNRPDFIAYQYGDCNRLSVRISRKLWRIQGVAWTLRTEEEFHEAVQADWIPIFEGFEP